MEGSDQSAWNAGVEYLKTLIEIERKIDDRFMHNDYIALDNLLDVLWMELNEWMTKKEEVELHNDLRVKQKIAYNSILKTKKISTEAKEQYINRLIALKKLIHSKNLRIKKMDDPSMAIGGSSF